MIISWYLANSKENWRVFRVGLFFAYTIHATERAPFVWESLRAGELSFLLIRPGSFCREIPLFPRPLPTRLKCSQNIPSDINPRTIETFFEIINDFAPSAIRTFSYHRLPYLEVRMTFVIDWLIDLGACSDFCTRAFNHCLFSFNKASCIFTRREGLILQ